MFESRRICAVIAVCFCSLLPVGGKATEVTLTAPGASKGFTEKLRTSSLSVATAGRENVTTQDILAAAQADYGRLIGVLYAAGFYSSVISINVDGREAANIPPLSIPRQINRIVLTVNPGAPFTLSRASVRPLAHGTKIPKEFAPGYRARGDLIRDAAKAGATRWREVGHAKVQVGAQNITADHKAHDLAVDIVLDPGPQLRFGKLIINQPSRVRAKRVQEIAGLPTGEVFSPELAKQSATRLRRSGAFRSVVFEESDTIGPGNTLDMTTKLTDAKRRRVGLGAELSTLEGLTLSGFWLHRNLFGGAERLRFDAEIGGIGGETGGIDYILSARFERPATFSPDTSLFLMATIEDLDDPGYRERNIILGGGLSHIFSDKLRGEAGITYRYSEVKDDLGSRTLQHLVFPLRLTWDKRDDPLNSTKGFYLALQGDPFLGLDQNTTGARAYADARAYHSVGAQKGLTFAARAQFGTIAGASINDIPPDMLFFSGGAGTVRGHAYQSLAVDLGGGLSVGGRSFMAFSGEIRAKLNDKFGMVTFADTGFVGRDELGKGTGRWHSGAGIGGRYATGLGPIRVDVATPLNSSAGKNFEIYIGIGQAF